MRIYSLILIVLLCVSCRNTRPENNVSTQSTEQFATLLNLSVTEEDYTLVKINNPWRPEEVAVQYLLVPSDDKRWNEESANTLTARYGNLTIVRTPLQRMTITSSCHAWLLSELSALDQVSVMCDTAYVMADNIRQWLRNSQVADGGSSMDPNREVLLASLTDGVWISPYENAASSQLANLPLTLIYCADYMETSPLARAEWMRFYGRLVGKGNEADQLFAEVASSYRSLVQTQETAATQDSINSRPQRTILAELPYGPTWYVPGGCSTSALLYKDAGYNYPWADDVHAGSLSLSPEAVLVKAIDCDRWIFKYMNPDGDWSMADFLQQNPYYSQFKAAKTGEVWGCNTSYSDFFDVTPFRPDLLLESLINDDERFFKKLK